MFENANYCYKYVTIIWRHLLSPSWIFCEVWCHFGLIVVSEPPAAFNFSFWTTLLCVSNKRVEKKQRGESEIGIIIVRAGWYLILSSLTSMLRQKLVHDKMWKRNGKFLFRIIQCKIFQLIQPAMTWKQQWCFSPFFFLFYVPEAYLRTFHIAVDF